MRTITPELKKCIHQARSTKRAGVAKNCNQRAGIVNMKRTTLRSSLQDTIQGSLNDAFHYEWRALMSEISSGMNVSFDLEPGAVRISDGESAEDYKQFHISELVDHLMEYDLDQDTAGWAKDIAEALEQQAKRLRKWASKV